MNGFFTFPIIWLAVITASVFLEAATEKLIAIWFAPAAGLGLVCAVIGMSPAAQILIFFGSAAGMVLISRIIYAVSSYYKKHNDGGDGIE